MSWSNPIFIISGAAGASFLLGYIFTKIWPPKEINDFYGYRTKRSKRSKEAWDFAQEYSTRMMLYITLLNLALGISGLFIQVEETLSFIISMGFMTMTVIWLFWKTESQLKEQFGE